MSDDVRNAVTLGIAIWGAITGTIALGLRILAHRKDRSRFLVRPEFEYITWDVPPDPRLHVHVVNTGRRPATVHQVYAALQAPNPLSQLLWWFRRTGMIPLGRRDSSREVSEGSEAVFTYKETGYTHVGLQDIRRIVVRDKVGRTWKSARQFGQDGLRDILEAELVDQQSRGEEGQRHAHFRLYKIGKGWHLLGSIKAGNTTTLPRRLYDKRGDAEAAMSTFLERAELFLAGDLQHDQVHEF